VNNCVGEIFVSLSDEVVGLCILDNCICGWLECKEEYVCIFLVRVWFYQIGLVVGFDRASVKTW